MIKKKNFKRIFATFFAVLVMFFASCVTFRILRPGSNNGVTAKADRDPAGSGSIPSTDVVINGDIYYPFFHFVCPMQGYSATPRLVSFLSNGKGGLAFSTPANSSNLTTVYYDPEKDDLVYVSGSSTTFGVNVSLIPAPTVGSITVRDEMSVSFDVVLRSGVGSERWYYLTFADSFIFRFDVGYYSETYPFFMTDTYYLTSSAIKTLTAPVTVGTARVFKNGGYTEEQYKEYGQQQYDKGLADSKNVLLLGQLYGASYRYAALYEKLGVGNGTGNILESSEFGFDILKDVPLYYNGNNTQPLKTLALTIMFKDPVDVYKNSFLFFGDPYALTLGNTSYFQSADGKTMPVLLTSTGQTGGVSSYLLSVDKTNPFASFEAVRLVLAFSFTDLNYPRMILAGDSSFSEYYGQGFTNGVEAGHDVAYNDGYQQGTADGKQEGIEEGKQQGYTDGYSQGYTKGDQDGYSRGLKTADYSFTDFFSGIIQAPINALSPLFKIEFMGINLLDFFGFILFGALIGIVIKFIL